MQILVLIGTLGASPQVGEILPLIDFLTVVSCTEMGDRVGFDFRCRTFISVCNQPCSHPRPTQPSISPGSVNEYQLRLGRQRQVWFIPFADKRGVCR